jgi:hypothetical protein
MRVMWSSAGEVAGGQWNCERSERKMDGVKQRTSE